MVEAPDGVSPAAIAAVWAAVAHQPDATYHELGRAARVSQRTAARAIRALIAAGHVVEERRRVRGRWRYTRQVATPTAIPAVPRRPRVTRNDLLELEALRAQLRRERAAYAELAAAVGRLMAAGQAHRAALADLFDRMEAMRRACG